MRVATVAVASLHAILVMLSTLGFFIFDPLVTVVVSNAAAPQNALDVVYSIVHAALCLVPVWLVIQSCREEGLMRGVKQALTVACSLVLVVQALRLACLTFVAVSAAAAIGSWLATLVALAVDGIALVVLLVLCITARLDSIRYQLRQCVSPRRLTHTHVYSRDCYSVAPIVRRSACWCSVWHIFCSLRLPSSSSPIRM